MMSRSAAAASPGWYQRVRLRSSTTRLMPAIARSARKRTTALAEPPAVTVGHEAQALTHLVDQAGLDPGLGVDGLDRLREAAQAVDAADQHVLETALLELGQHP
jgi:hypothetical protein